MFKPEISWLKNFGTKFGLDSELLDLIKDKFPEEFLEDVVQALIKSGDGYACYYYCRSGTKVDVSTIIACFISYCESSHELILTLSEENDKLRKEVDRIKITHLF